MLTIFFVFIFHIHVSYTDTKYSDFGKNDFFSDFIYFGGILLIWKTQLTQTFSSVVLDVHVLYLIAQLLKKNNLFKGCNMAILDNLESYLGFLDKEPENLATKIFSETVCKNCESAPMIETDNMGRETSMYSQG